MESDDEARIIVGCFDVEVELLAKLLSTRLVEHFSVERFIVFQIRLDSGLLPRFGNLKGACPRDLYVLETVVMSLVGVGLLVDELDSIIFREASESALPGAGVELIRGWYFHEPDNTPRLLPQPIHTFDFLDVADFLDAFLIYSWRHYPVFASRRSFQFPGSIQV